MKLTVEELDYWAEELPKYLPKVHQVQDSIPRLIAAARKGLLYFCPHCGMMPPEDSAKPLAASCPRCGATNEKHLAVECPSCYESFRVTDHLVPVETPLTRKLAADSLKERLRHWAYNYSLNNPLQSTAIFDEALARIEQLEADSLKDKPMKQMPVAAQIPPIVEMADSLKEQLCKPPTGGVAVVNSLNGKALARIEQLEAENASLREAEKVKWDSFEKAEAEIERLRRVLKEMVSYDGLILVDYCAMAREALNPPSTGEQKEPR